MQPTEIVSSFIEAINQHDVARIVALCTEDHEFVDAYGGAVRSAALFPAWTGYFKFMPHYEIAT
jgi:ketosteroid isomerase-like protein